MGGLTVYALLFKSNLQAKLGILTHWEELNPRAVTRHYFQIPDTSILKQFICKS